MKWKPHLQIYMSSVQAPYSTAHFWFCFVLWLATSLGFVSEVVDCSSCRPANLATLMLTIDTSQ